MDGIRKGNDAYVLGANFMISKNNLNMSFHYKCCTIVASKHVKNVSIPQVTKIYLNCHFIL